MTTGSRTEGVRGIGSNGFIRTVANLTVTGDLVVLGENRALAGTGSFFWEDADANAEYWAFELPTGTSEHVPVLGVGVGLDGVDLGLFDGITQPTVAVLDADRDSFIAMDFSGDDAGRLRSNATINITPTGALSVGTDGTGNDVIFYSGTSGDNFTWDSSEEVLQITGTNGATAFDVLDGDVRVVDTLYFFDRGGEYMSSDGSTLAIVGNTSVAGNLLPSADDTYDLGSASAAWQDLFLEGDIALSDATAIAITAAAHDTVGPALTISAGDTTAGTTNNIAGGAVTIQGGQGKGSGAGGDIIFQTANAGGSGSAINALATALTISDDLSSTFAGAVTIDGDVAFTGPQQISTSSGVLTIKAATNTNILRAGDGTIVSMTRNAVGSWDFYLGNTALGTGVAGTGSLELRPTAGNTEFAILQAGTTTAKFVVNSSTGVVQIGGTADHSGTVGTNLLSIFDGTAPVNTLANGCSFYSTSGVMFVMQADGVATELSPHNPETGEWWFNSTNTVTGRVYRVHMERMMERLDEMLGGGFVEEFIEEV